MTRHDDFTALLENYLDEYEGATPLPADVRDSVRARIPSTMQRPAWWPGRRLPAMNNMMRLALASAAVVAVAVVGFAALRGDGSVGDPPNDQPSAQASVGPTPTVEPIPRAELELAPGRYSVRDEFPVGVTFDVPSGWVSCISNPGFDQGVCSADPPGRGVAFLIIDNVVSDPCDATSAPEPAIGPSVDDLVNAISALDGFEVTRAVDVSLSGFEGRSIEVTAPLGAGCDLVTWSTGGQTNGVGPGEVNLMRIIDVQGIRVVVSGAYQSTETTDEQLAELQAILASVELAAP